MIVRPALESDLPAVAEMIDDFVKDHPAAKQPRPLETLRDAFFGPAKLSHLVVATNRDRVVGMVTWWLFYDVFWAMRGVHGEWLYVRPGERGLGISVALVAEVCQRGREVGAVFLRGGSSEEHIARLYERVAIGVANRECFVSAEAFQVFADQAGKPAREIVRNLPTPELSRVPAGAR